MGDSQDLLQRHAWFGPHTASHIARTCCLLGMPESGSPRWRWISGCRSPVGEQPTIGWCADCTQERSKGQVLIEDVNRISPDSAETGDDYVDTVDVCPRCGCGEAGAEHIAVFCRAVAKAWSKIGPPEMDWWLGTHLDQDLQLQLAFNHAVSWLCCALAQNAAEDYMKGCELILRQIAGNRGLEELNSSILQSTFDPDESNKIRRLLGVGPLHALP